MTNKQPGKEGEQENYFQIVCDKHEWVQVITSVTIDNGIEISGCWQCRLCGLLMPNDRDDEGSDTTGDAMKNSSFGK